MNTIFLKFHHKKSKKSGQFAATVHYYCRKKCAKIQVSNQWDYSNLNLDQSGSRGGKSSALAVRWAPRAPDTEIKLPSSHHICVGSSGLWWSMYSVPNVLFFTYKEDTLGAFSFLPLGAPYCSSSPLSFYFLSIHFEKMTVLERSHRKIWNHA